MFKMATFYSVCVFAQLVFVYISSSAGVDITISRDLVEERECAGTANGFSCSGTPEFRYDQLKKRYTGCTYVLGNLEITHLDEPDITYDLSFLRHIRYVSGYVLIGLFGEVNRMPLLNLEIIRGNDTFRFQGEDYSLMVALTSRDLEDSPANGLHTLMMPKLKEISRGKVMFIKNPHLGHMDTVDWAPILRGRMDAVHFGVDPFNQTESNSTDTELCGGGGMWGNDVTLCQEVVNSPQCDVSCDDLCFGSGPLECCHETCAIGCSGPSERDCMQCKDFEYQGKCVSFCPDMTYRLMQKCISYTPLNPL